MGCNSRKANVVNCREGSDYDIYIGRGRDPRTRRRGEWGNPYSHRPSRVPGVIKVASVEEAVARYRVALWQRIQSGDLPLEKLAELHGRTLGCWCSPAPCHGEVLADAAAWAARQLDLGR